MSYEQKEFIKELNGVAAPKGFHFMPNGKLMNDAHHIAQFGYIQKVISGFNIDTTDIDPDGESRGFVINGDSGAYFSIIVYDNNNNYYDFYNSTWVSNNVGLYKVRLEGDGYTNNISFPAATSKTYTIDVIAEIVGNCQTTHVGLNEVNNEDGTINLNESTGSDSLVLTKILSQDQAIVLTLSCIAPSLYTAGDNLTIDGAVSNANKFIVDETLTSKNIGLNDLVTGGSGGTEMTTAEFTLVTSLNPDRDNVKEFQTSVNNSVSDGTAISLTPPFNGVQPHFTDSTSGADLITSYTGASFSKSFSVEVQQPVGRALLIDRLPTTDDLCVVLSRTIGSAGIALEGENTSGGSLFFRFPIDNIVGLSSGMELDPRRNATNVTKGSFISSYTTTKTLTNVVEGPYTSSIQTKNILDVNVKGVDPVGNDVRTSDRNGIPTAQLGNVVFNKQQAAALAGDTVRIIARGQQQIQKASNMIVNIRDVEIVNTSTFTATTTSGVNDSTTIPLNQVGAAAIGAKISGPQVVDATIVSKSTNTGAGTIVVSANQTLDSGQSVFTESVKGFEIRGVIDVQNVPLSNTSLYFDLERFITCG
tara:strand:+ start:4785 stop:6551 length:1767 start_codon:yes stop_codon:yes gene_type:complete